MLIDTHCHLNYAQFSQYFGEICNNTEYFSIDNVIQRALDNEVSRLLFVSTDLDDMQISLDIAQKYDFVFSAAGLHPSNANAVYENLDFYQKKICDAVNFNCCAKKPITDHTQFAKNSISSQGRLNQSGKLNQLDQKNKSNQLAQDQLKQQEKDQLAQDQNFNSSQNFSINFPIQNSSSGTKKLIAIGEIGFDLHYEDADIRKQIAVFHMQKQIANNYQLPILIHTRDANEYVLEHAKHEHGALIHCFCGDLDFAKKLLDMGCFLSFSGIVTYKKSETIREVARYAPIDRIFIETDAPFLAPQSVRGNVNEPRFLQEIARTICAEKGVDFAEFSLQMQRNWEEFFRV